MIRASKIVLLIAVLLAASYSSRAEQVQSATSVYLTFRNCVAVDTACDSFDRQEMSATGGQRGEPTAHAGLADPAFGEASGDVQLTAVPGAAEFNTNVRSLPVVRTGSTNMILQRYTNASVAAESLTLMAAMTFSQTVPTENTSFPAESGTESGPFVEMLFFQTDDEFFEVGTTAEENFAALLGESGEPPGFEELSFGKTGPDSNSTEEGSKNLSITTVVQPGDSVWYWAGLQAFAVNGAVVNATMTTELSVTKL